MDASQITKLNQIQNTRYINRNKTIDSSTLTWKNLIQSATYISGVPTCTVPFVSSCNIPTNSCCADQISVNGNLTNTGVYSFGGSGRTTAIQNGSPQQFLNVLAGASGSFSQVYSSENIVLQAAGRNACGTTSPTQPNYPDNAYVVLPGGNPNTSNAELLNPSCNYLCLNTNGPTTNTTTGLNNPSVPGNSTITGNPNDLAINNQSNPYLPPFDTYYRFKNASAQCKNCPDQNQKHFVQECHTRFPNANNGVPTAFDPSNNVTLYDPITKTWHTQTNGAGTENPPTAEGCIIQPPVN
jgi:hypothetical protein